MKVIDDIDALKVLVDNPYNRQTILNEQIKLVNQNIPYVFLGAIVPSIMFFMMMYFTVDLSVVQKILNMGWVFYVTITILVSWMLWNKIYKRPKHLDINFVKTVFLSYAGISLVLGIISIIILINLWLNSNQIVVNGYMIILAICYIVISLIYCWTSLTKFKKISNLDNKVDNAQSRQYTLASDSQQVVMTKGDDTYLSNYLAYRLLLVCAFSVGALWSLLIAKVVLTNIQAYTQIICMLGLHFGIMGGAISTIGIFWRVYLSLALPSMLAWVFALAMLNESRLQILALAILLLLSFTILFSRHTWLYTIRTILVYMENKELVTKLRHKSKQVEQASLARTQFLASASHDLRQPIHALNLFLETLSDTPLTPRQTKIVGHAKTASRSSREMLNSILNYAHLESGAMTPNIQATELDHIIQNLVDEFSIQAQQKNLTLRYRTTHLTVLSDPSMLSLVLRNFLSNALRYTSTGGVLIGVRKLPLDYHKSHQPHCRISVWDTGRGINASEIKQIFDSFYQSERNNGNQGLGLGLSIVQGIAKLLDADISVKSTVGRGSQFSIDLPLCKRPNLSAPNTVTTNNQIFEGVSVLIVDDEQNVLVSMELLLDYWGFDVVTATTVKEVVTAVDIKLPDIIITDYRLADSETGQDVIDATRNISTTDIAYVILTGDTSPELMPNTVDLNIRILHKPIDPKALNQHLRSIVLDLKANSS